MDKNKGQVGILKALQTAEYRNHHQGFLTALYSSLVTQMLQSKNTLF